MIALIQRVSRAAVTIDGDIVAAVDRGVLAFVAAEPHDDRSRAQRLAERVLAYRIFADEHGRMALGASDIGAGVLAVPQFTLAADTRRGNRPGFSTACPAREAAPLFACFLETLEARHAPIRQGVFGADMQVELVNDGPVTFWLEA